jgi:uncharacterized protein (TIGR00288 family)
MVTDSHVEDRQLAVLIDFENVGLDSIQWLFDQISDVGRIIVKRAYADWTTAGHRRDLLLQLGIEPIHLFHSQSGKNSSDIRLAIDAVDLQYQSSVDVFVIVSSDSDFVPLVSKLRAAGKTVIGAGRRATASRTLVISCDRFFYLEQAERRASGKKGPGPPKDESVLVRAVTAACDEQGRVVGSKLYQTIQRMDPSFDYRAAGYSTFTRYLDASPEVQVVRPKGQGDVSVELADASPPEDWAAEIDTAWTERAPSSGQAIPASTAASDAAKVLGATKLSASQYKTLQKLLDAADTLRQRWRRDGNRIILR